LTRDLKNQSQMRSGRVFTAQLGNR